MLAIAVVDEDWGIEEWGEVDEEDFCLSGDAAFLKIAVAVFLKGAYVRQFRDNGNVTHPLPSHSSESEWGHSVSLNKGLMAAAAQSTVN